MTARKEKQLCFDFDKVDEPSVPLISNDKNLPQTEAVDFSFPERLAKREFEEKKENYQKAVNRSKFLYG